jgi:PKD repeat protein
MVSRNRKQFVYLCFVLATVGAVVFGIVGSPRAEDSSSSVVCDSAGSSWGSYQGEISGDTQQTDFALKLRLNRPPDRPSNASPANGATGISLAPVLQSSAFSDPDARDTQAAAQWQITSVSHNYSISVYDSRKDTLNLTSITVPPGNLRAATTYYWHVRHQDSHRVWSSWSAETSFSTASPQPTVTGVSPSQGIQGQTLDVTVTGTNFTGATGVSFDPKIKVNSFVVNDSTRITAVVTISAAAVPGLSSISVTAPKGAGTLTDGFTVYAPPQADFSAGATQVATGQTIGFISSSLGGIPPLTYAWDFDNDGGIDSTNQNPSYSYGVDGTHTVSLKVTDSSGNSDTETKTGYVTAGKAIEPHDIMPQDATAVTTTDGRTAMTFPAEEVTVYATAATRQISSSSVADAPEGFKAGSCFTVEATDVRGNAIVNFPRLVTITVTYSDEDLALAGDDPENLVLAHYNENTGRWITHETKLNGADRTLSATTTHFGTWAILAKSPSRGLSLWIQVIMGIAIALGLGIAAGKCISVEVEWQDRVPELS